MELTGKCKEKFEQWFSDNYGKFETTSFQECASAPLYQVYFDEIDLPKEIESSLMIEFFDNNDIFICVNKWSLSFWKSSIYNPHINSLGCNFETRQEATIQAIKKANDLYNNANEI